MSNDFTALSSALYSVLNGGATVSVYYALAPQNTAAPYCIFQRQSAVDDYYLAGTAGNRTVTADYQVKVVDDGLWPGAASNIYGHVHALMDDAALSVSGFTTLRSRRNQSLEYRDDEGFWHVGGIYTVEIDETT